MSAQPISVLNSPESSRLKHLHFAHQHLPGAAVDGDPLALLQGHAASRHCLGGVVDTKPAGARDAGLAHAARHHGGVRGHAAARRQDALGRVHAVDVLRARLYAHEDDLAARSLGPLGIVGVEHDLAAGRTWGRRQPGRDDLALGVGIDGRMKQLIQRRGVDAAYGLFLRDQALAGEIDRDLQRRLGRALAIARLEHPELAAFDGELDVLHVAVMLFQQPADSDELGIGLGHGAFEGRPVGPRRDARLLGDVLGRADARHHVLALRVDEELAIQLLRAGGRIAREGDPGRRGLAKIAEHHGLHVDGSAPARGNAVQLTILDGALVHPGAKHGADRAPELVVGILRERLAELLLNRRLVLPDQNFPIVGGQVGVERIALPVLVLVEMVLEEMVPDAEHDVRIHLDEAAIAVIGKARIARAPGDGLYGDVVEAEIEDGVHHARHRGARARAHGHQQRVLRIAERLAGDDAHLRERFLDLGVEAGGIGLAVVVIVGAQGGRDREAGGHREAQIAHLGEVRTLAAKQIAHSGLTLGLAVAEREHPLRHRRVLFVQLRNHVASNCPPCPKTQWAKKRVQDLKFLVGSTRQVQFRPYFQQGRL